MAPDMTLAHGHDGTHDLGSAKAQSASQGTDLKVPDPTNIDSAVIERHDTNDDLGGEKAQSTSQEKDPKIPDSADGGSLWDGAMARLMDWRSKAERPTTDSMDTKGSKTTPVKRRPRSHRRIGGLSLDEDLF